MLSNYESIWIGHFSLVSITKDQFEFSLVDGKPIQFSPFREFLKARKFEVRVPDEMLSGEVIEPAKT